MILQIWRLILTGPWTGQFTGGGNLLAGSSAIKIVGNINHLTGEKKSVQNPRVVKLLHNLA